MKKSVKLGAAVLAAVFCVVGMYQYGRQGGGGGGEG